MCVSIGNNFCSVVVFFFVFQKALWSDMFTGRLKSEIPEALVSVSLFHNTLKHAFHKDRSAT